MDKRTTITISQTMLPSQANYSGNVHGGEIMKLMDTAAGTVARRYARSNVVTARVDEMEFLYPVFINAFLICTATIAYVGNTSMEVFVTVDVEDLESEDPPRRTLSAFFTMVALDRMGKPKKLPPLVLETEEEKRLFEEGRNRREARQAKLKHQA
jgi:acyl-CoA hydrolase